MSDSSNRPLDGGIAFGGGAGNEYVRAFEERRDALRQSGDPDGMVRDEILSIKPFESDAPAEETPAVRPDADEPVPASDIRMDDASVLQDNGERTYTGFRLPDSITGFSYLGYSVANSDSSPEALPEEEDAQEESSILYDEEDLYDDEEYDDELYEEDEEPLHGFKKLFSESGVLTGMMLTMGIMCAAFFVLYVITINVRDFSFANAMALLANRPEKITIEFDYPLLPFLKVLLYLVPFAAIFFVAALIVEDKNGKRYNKKMIVAILVLLLLAVAAAAFDMVYAHLLF